MTARYRGSVVVVTIPSLRYGDVSPVNGYLRGQGELHMGPCHDKRYDGDRDDDDDVSLLTFQLNPKLNHDGTSYSMVSRD
jgi:hypothetical protein